MFHFTDDPNFPIFYQKLIVGVLALVGLGGLVVCAVVIGAVISWMNSGSH